MPGAASKLPVLATWELVVFGYVQKQWYKEPLIK